MDSSLRSPLVSVGIVTYNRPKGLKRTLECITGQSYRNLEIIVSDNCSDGEDTQKVVADFAKHDDRIKYYRQDENKGAVSNFRFVLENATGEYFMWGSDDDLWEESFVDTGLKELSKSNYDAWFCNFDNIDSLDRAIKTYDQFTLFTSLKNKKKEISRYLEEPGMEGKANVIYSLFTTEALKKTAEEYFFNDKYACDTAFNLAFLARYNLLVTDDLLFHKRVFMKHVVDAPGKIIPLVSKRPNRTLTPKRYRGYCHECCKATKGTAYAKNAIMALIIQIPRVVISGILDKIESIKKPAKKH